jgi:membrane fusion protein (multidrug efflux system)
MAEQPNCPSVPTTPMTEPVAEKGNRKRVLLIIAAVFATIAILFTLYYFLYSQFHEVTDDAYVNGNLVYINSQVGGTVVGLGADDTEPVKAGHTLITLEGSDSTIALANAQAKLAETVRQIRTRYRSTDEATAVVAQRKTELGRATDDLNRRLQLAGSDAITAEDLAHARAAVAAAKDTLTVAHKQLESSQASVEGTTLSQHPSVLQARAEFTQAYLAESRNVIPAPIDGYVARRSVQIGQHVTPGNNLMAIVPLNALWVDANLKEMQLRNVRIGQPATVTADIYGGHVEYHGKVSGIAAGTGGAFSLLPPQNAVGNWIKVVQRIPVRISLDAEDLKKHPLRIGMSTTVDIDTHDRKGSVLTALPIANVPMTTPVYDMQLKVAQAKADRIIAQEAGADAGSAP